MLVALDKNKNRIYAEEVSKDNKELEIYCPYCGAKLELRKGKINRAHFAHIRKDNCSYDNNEDHMSEWHKRMQLFFPKETREFPFKDKISGELHIADIYIEKFKTVIEFQKSKIGEDEFLSRTWFHLNNGRRIVWVFNESTSGYKENNQIGKFKKIYKSNIYGDNWFRWTYLGRKFLNKGPALKEYKDNYSVCIYTEEEGDVVRRIINESEEFKKVCMLNKVEINSNIDLEQMFYDEDYWDYYKETNNYMEASFKQQRKKYEPSDEIKKIVLDIELRKELIEKKYSLNLGDSLYFKRNNSCEIEQCDVWDYNIEKDLIIIRVNNYKREKFSINPKYIGKTVFRTKQEVEASILDVNILTPGQDGN